MARPANTSASERSTRRRSTALRCAAPAGTRLRDARKTAAEHIVRRTCPNAHSSVSCHPHKMVPVRRLSIAQITIATILLVSTLHAADVTVSGHVTDDNDARVADATITVRAAGAKEVWESRSGASGAWSLTLPQPGEYL